MDTPIFAIHEQVDALIVVILPSETIATVVWTAITEILVWVLTSLVVLVLVQEPLIRDILMLLVARWTVKHKTWFANVKKVTPDPVVTSVLTTILGIQKSLVASADLASVAITSIFLDRVIVLVNQVNVFSVCLTLKVSAVKSVRKAFLEMPFPSNVHRVFVTSWAAIPL